ncbi:MAG: YbaB/EbfC family nucleoid-associated protein [Phycisphaeraceae bacterium]|nr:YbaB/EbfC family nucleoid-associated protein [Phycisphaeraceae bacterium]
MFDQFKAMGALAGLMKNKEKLREAGERMQSTLEAARIVGQAGAGLVRVEVSGRLRVLRVEIDPVVASSMGDERSRREAESMITEAVNDAMRAAERVIQQESQRMARELGIEDMPGMEGLTRMLGS